MTPHEHGARLKGLAIRVVAPPAQAPWQQDAVTRLRRQGAAVQVVAPTDEPSRSGDVRDVVLVLDPESAPPQGRSWCFDFETDPRRGLVTAFLLEVDGSEAMVLRSARMRWTPASATTSTEALLREAAMLPVRAALDLVRTARPTEAGQKRSRPTGVRPVSAVPRKAAAGAHTLRRQLDRVMRANHWSIGAARLSDLSGTAPANGYVWAELPEDGGFLADPFLVPGSQPLTVLAEQLTAHDLTGRIVRLELGEDGWSPPEPVLPLPVHASYPYLFTGEIDGQTSICLVPETSALRQVRLYRGAADGRSWRLHRVLLHDVALADPTVFHHAGRWWLFGTDADSGVNTHLCAYWAEDLDGPWRPHAANPVKVDIASARPAGTPWVDGAGLVRPGQDSTERYGAQVVLHRITRLDPNEFEEVPYGVVGPDPRGAYPDGLHTVCREADRVVIDGCRRAPAVRRVVPALRRQLTRAPEEVR
ncbi:MAG TPA: hypothetical protein VFX33_00885 [Actinomycetales bacterium]|nr:hypothetical protein [Actinomycetales bacterium]